MQHPMSRQNSFVLLQEEQIYKNVETVKNSDTPTDTSNPHVKLPSIDHVLQAIDSYQNEQQINDSKLLLEFKHRSSSQLLESLIYNETQQKQQQQQQSTHQPQHHSPPSQQHYIHNDQLTQHQSQLQQQHYESNSSTGTNTPIPTTATATANSTTTTTTNSTPSGKLYSKTTNKDVDVSPIVSTKPELTHTNSTASLNKEINQLSIKSELKNSKTPSPSPTTTSTTATRLPTSRASKTRSNSNLTNESRSSSVDSTTSATDIESVNSTKSNNSTTNSNSNSSSRKRTNLPKETIEILNDWIMQNMDNPYPNHIQKKILLAKTGLSNIQLSNWFINKRRRRIFSNLSGNNGQPIKKKRLIDRI